MAIIRHSKLNNEEKEVKSVKKASNFTPEEAAFLISKLRQAQYQGTEFETFYQIMSKLTKIAEKQ